MRKFSCLLPLLLIGCGTPQERCIASVTRDMRVVDRLIVAVEGNLKRGYAFEEKEVLRTRFVDCSVGGVAQMCLDDVTTTERSAVAVDLVAEAAKLASLKAKRAAQATEAAPAISSCRAEFPK
jgi:hypothetical protein